MLIRNKRALLARGLGAIGFLGLLERLGRRPGLLVLTYHRIGQPERSAFYEPIFSATPEGFRAQVRLLRERYRLVRLEEAVELVAAGLPLRDPAVLITFDDGYRDNAELALPVLQELGAPAAFFLVSDWLRRPTLPWWDRIAFALKRSTAAKLLLDRPRPVEVDLVHRPRSEAIWDVVKLVLAQPGLDDPEFLAHVEERAGVGAAPTSAAQDLFMTADHARSLSAAGMAIGSHSQTHPNLGQRAPAEQLRELRESKQALEGIVGKPVDALAYPFGGPGAVTPETERLAREAGYRVAFSAQTGLNRPGQSEPFALRRMNVGAADSLAMVRTRAAFYTACGASPV
jgi:peptidoglycan/xylan/chitin deacetylase (PgdA/CDA1 family)